MAPVPPREPPLPAREPYVSSALAIEILGVRSATLYAYVSRGLVRTRTDPADPRKRTYNLKDLEALVRRKRLAKRPNEAAISALDFGLPVMSSEISAIDERRILYRGHDIVAWSAGATLEETAALLWDCTADIFAAPHGPEPAPRVGALREGRVERRCLVAMARLAANAPADHPHARQSDLADAAAVLRTMLAVVLGRRADARPVHMQLSEHWGLGADAADLCRLALSLSADYELNTATFGVRVVASTGASLAACVCAGLAAYGSPFHAGQMALIERVFEEAETEDDAGALRVRLERSEAPPIFGLQLHEDGDPRARAILERLPSGSPCLAVVDAMAGHLGKHPNLNIALVAMRRTLSLPPDAAITLFLLGRCVGWISHALEQQASDRPIRPRARYTGPQSDL
ncbi:citrate synthase [Acuticoccus mangrovi]|uniref:citrate synthase (unknown stereospecificity) n=1 Tax=Acuticoccus mangrovi TaxID=2796142 RepID=A0A934IMT5_9HYPH|nr:citrate synthase [Acuticoccus mangrovi]MBJ3776732.1 hypothetical protein [Acuticoccus mangrovi]